MRGVTDIALDPVQRSPISTRTPHAGSDNGGWDLHEDN